LKNFVDKFDILIIFYFVSIVFYLLIKTIIIFVKFLINKKNLKQKYDFVDLPLFSKKRVNLINLINLTKNKVRPNPKDRRDWEYQ